MGTIDISKENQASLQTIEKMTSVYKRTMYFEWKNVFPDFKFQTFTGINKDLYK